MSKCESCGGGCCGSCGGCGSSLTVTPGEVHVLTLLAQIPFLPIARRIDDAAPIFLEDSAYPPEEYALILQCLEKKGLVSLDFDQPLKNADLSRYAACPIHGSMALTARGQTVLDLLDLQGADG